MPIPVPTLSDDLYNHPFFKEEYSLSTLPYDESIESMITSRRMRATPSVSTPSPSPAPKRQKAKGKTKRTMQLKDAGLVGGDSDSSALTQESAEDGAPTPKDSAFTGTDAGTEVDDEDIDMQDASPGPSLSYSLSLCRADTSQHLRRPRKRQRRLQPPPRKTLPRPAQLRKPKRRRESSSLLDTRSFVICLVILL